MTSLYDAVLEILETPMTRSAIMNELYRYNISAAVTQSGFVKGYLDALVDLGHLYVIGTVQRMRMYSKHPGKEYAHRRCPYCQTQILIFDSDIGLAYSCPKCKEESIVTMTFKDGVQLQPAEGVQ